MRHYPPKNTSIRKTKQFGEVFFAVGSRNVVWGLGLGEWEALLKEAQTFWKAGGRQQFFGEGMRGGEGGKMQWYA